MTDSKHQYVVFKGVEGFADRLQCLLQVIAYAKATRRTLVVDWRDADWQHDPSADLSDFFVLEGVSSLPIDDFLSRFAEEGKCLSVYPEAWSERIETPDFREFCREDQYKLPDNSKSIQAICDGGRCDFEADVVVYAGIGERTYEYKLAKHLMLACAIKQRIEEFASRLSLHEQAYDVVHLRGGSKTWMGGFVADSSPVKDQHEKWADVDAYLSPIWEVYQHLLSLNPGDRPLLLLSDHPSMIEAWKERYNCGVAIDNSVPGVLSESGIHKLAPGDLARIGSGLTKAELNYECIRDFVVMMNSRVLVGDGVSLFSLMAFQLKTADVRWCRFPSWAF